MKEIYESLEAELICFEAADVIITSGGSGDTETTPVPAGSTGFSLF